MTLPSSASCFPENPPFVSGHFRASFSCSLYLSPRKNCTTPNTTTAPPQTTENISPFAHQPGDMKLAMQSTAAGTALARIVVRVHRRLSGGKHLLTGACVRGNHDR